MEGEELSVGSVQLDDHQEAVARAIPPLVIESRSGTGKTLILLQHAAYHADDADERPSCFLTVSPRLSRQLSQTYKKMNLLDNLSLPPTRFYSLDELLLELLSISGADPNFKDMAKCRFLGFSQSRSPYSHTGTQIESHLIEDEIGGVICGSVDAAIQRAPLTRDQYLATKRSNIGNKDENGCKERNLVYDEYERYSSWKETHKKFDVGDVILKLLTVQFPVLFSAGMIYTCWC